MTRSALFFCVLGATSLALFTASRAANSAAKALRGPTALVATSDGKLLFSANQRSGTVSVLDTIKRRVLAEIALGRKLTDLTAAPDGRLLAVDQDAHELIVLSQRDSTLEVTGRVPVRAWPVGVRAAGSRAFVTSLWSRQLSVVDLKTFATRALELPFSPRALLPLGEGDRVVVADAFGGRLAVVDTVRNAVESVRELPGHNLRGLAASGDGQHLLLVHQTLSATAQTSFGDIHWGNLLTNNLRQLPLAVLRRPDADLLHEERLYQLGDIGVGAGDPSGLAVLPGGRLAVTFGGVGEVAISDEKTLQWKRLAVGQRPTAVVASPDGKRLYVADALDDTVAIVDVAVAKVTATIPLGPRPALSAADRGERLFYDARLAHDGWMSCHSCHPDGHSNGRLADTQGDGSSGTPKRVLSLLGVRDTEPYAWNGSMPDLETQIRQSIRSTMQGQRVKEEQVHDLAAYLRTLSPPPALPVADEEAVRRGADLFARLACASCHTPPEYTSRRTFEVGLADEAGLRLFNPPSLRGVGHGGPYFHDGRAATLADVFTKHRHLLKEPLATQDRDDLLAFLRSL